MLLLPVAVRPWMTSAGMAGYEGFVCSAYFLRTGDVLRAYVEKGCEVPDLGVAALVLLGEDGDEELEGKIVEVWDGHDRSQYG